MTPIGNHQYSARTPRYGGLTGITSEKDHRALKRDDVKYMTTSTSDQSRGEQELNDTLVKFFLNDENRILIASATGKSAYFATISGGTGNNIMHLVS